MKHIEHLLRRKIGLDAASVGSSSIERTLRLRMKNLDLKRPEDYLQRLESTPEEWEELIESVVVTETWFFRDRDPFVAFVRLALESMPRRAAEPLRVLSLPCSSGEEPYSLAMALLDAELPPERFTIDGVDISARALARAQDAVYGKNSFRGKHLDFRDRHFLATKDGLTLHPRVRNCVRFHHANLLDDKCLTGCAEYDFIFCRNLLIYFDRATQAKALEKLHGLLSPLGVLFVGPAELPLVTRHGFVSANVPMAFACRKATAPAAPTVAGRPRVGRPTKSDSPSPPPRSTPEPFSPDGHLNGPTVPSAWPKPKATSAPEPLRRGEAPPQKIKSPPLADLAAARQMADSGNLEEAAILCEEHLRQQGPSAQAYYLLGLVQDANGDPRAMDCYRKALYLEPDHYETLLQMALLLEKNGDSAGARTFKRRAQRKQAKA